MSFRRATMSWPVRGVAAVMLATLFPHQVSAQPRRIEVSHRVSPTLTVHADLYRTDAPADAPVILLFHQGGGDARGEYSEIIPRLTTAGYHVLSTDVRGGGTRFGGTPRAQADTGFRYCDAIADVNAAPEMVRANGLTGPLIIWGSSYTGTLAMQLAAKRTREVRAVLAFSPARGEPLRECEPDQYIGILLQQRIPLMIVNASAELQMPGRRERLDSLTARGVHTLIANGSGHGSSVLVASRFDGTTERQWKAVMDFLHASSPHRDHGK